MDFPIKNPVLANIKYSYKKCTVTKKIMLELKWIVIDTISPNEINILCRHNEKTTKIQRPSCRPRLKENKLLVERQTGLSSTLFQVFIFH